MHDHHVARLPAAPALPGLRTRAPRLPSLRLDRARLPHAPTQRRPHVLPRVPARATERAVEAPPTDRPDVAGALAALEAVKRQRAAVNALCAALAAITETPKETT